MAYNGVQSGSFSISSALDGAGTRRISVRGELDLAHSSELRDELLGELSSAASVVLDLSRVPFIDSTGLSAIVAAVNRARELDCGFQVSSELQPQARRLMELTGVLPLLSLEGAPSPD